MHSEVSMDYLALCAVDVSRDYFVRAILVCALRGFDGLPRALRGGR